MDEPTATTTIDPADTSSSNMNINNTISDNDELTTASLRKSALQDNIERKGKNAYYFAHSHKANGPEWDGKVEPKLLSSMSISSLNDNEMIDSAIISKPATTVSSFDYSKSNITTYAFLDDGAKIKIYIDLENVGEQCTDNDITLDYTDCTLSFTLQNYKSTKLLFGSSTENQTTDNEGCFTAAVPPQILRFGKLCFSICNASYRMKKDKIIITLTKEDTTKVWHMINDQGTSTDHHEVV